MKTAGPDYPLDSCSLRLLPSSPAIPLVVTTYLQARQRSLVLERNPAVAVTRPSIQNLFLWLTEHRCHGRGGKKLALTPEAGSVEGGSRAQHRRVGFGRPRARELACPARERTQVVVGKTSTYRTNLHLPSRLRR